MQFAILEDVVIVELLELIFRRITVNNDNSFIFIYHISVH